VVIYLSSCLQTFFEIFELREKDWNEEKKFQTKGIGTVMLNLLEKKALGLGIKKLNAKVLIGNESSKKIFVKNNYKLKTYLFEKEIF